MPTDADRPVPFANPRPGVVVTLGILNVVFATVILLGLLTEVLWLVGASQIARAEAKEAGAAPADPAYLFTLGMTDRKFVGFCLVDAVTGTVLNLAMLGSGIGLINLRRWGARAWKWAAGLKIARLWLLGAVFVVAISPTLAEGMARSVIATLGRGRPPGRGPQVGDLIWIYSVMNLIMAGGMVLLGTIYPAVTLWMIGRPGVKAALAGSPPEEPGQP